MNITEKDMQKALSNLNTSKSQGPDLLHPRILKELSNELSYPLKKLFDRSMEEGILPSQWKLQEVRPLS